MLATDLLWKPINYPWVHQCLTRGQSFTRVPLQGLLQEIKEIFIFCTHQILQLLSTWLPHPPFLIWLNFGRIFIEKLLRSATLIDHLRRRHSQHLHEQCHLFVLIFPWEYWVSSVQLSKDTGHRPDIDSTGVGDAEDDLGSTIESALNVSVDLFLLVAAAAHVDDLDARFILVFEHDVLGL